MHILLLDLGSEWRGGQRQVLFLAQALMQAEAAQVTLVSPRHSPLLDRGHSAGISTLTLPGTREWHPGNWLCLRRQLRKKVDIVHTNDARSAALGAMLRRCVPGNWRLVHTRRVSYPVRRGLLGGKYHCGDHVVAVSGEIKTVLTQSRVPRERISVIHSAVNPEGYRRRDPALPWPQSPMRLGCIGSLTPQKGHSVLLDALALARQENRLPPWRLEVIGSGPLADTLQHQAHDLSLDGQVDFVGYRESTEVLPELDVLIVPSVDGEGSSGVVKEGWISGVPVVASDLPGTRELVADGHNGVLFTAGSADQLASVLATLATDTERANRCVAGGLTSSTHYTPQVMATQYHSVYERLLER